MIRKLLLLLLPAALLAQPDADTILKRVDENIIADTKILTSTMQIETRRGSRSVTSKSWIRGEDEAFTEYLAPPREKGTKMLKLDDQLWTYSPQTDRTIKISGHMLRQSVMGSDLSYEDMMEDKSLREAYEAQVVGEETVLGQNCWVLELTAIEDEVAYPTRKVWVARDIYVTMKEERYAKSGRLLKTTAVLELEKIDGRWVATRARFKDQLKNGNGTIFIIDSIKFNEPIASFRFSKAALKK